MADATVRLKSLDSGWQTLGADRLRGIVAEGIIAATNEWGPDTFDFTLRAKAGAMRPDVLPYTPVELEIDGLVCWAGFVWQRPSDANGYAVGCRGWQYHLDDDLYDRAYVHTRMSDWQDIRSNINSNLSRIGTAAGEVQAADAGIVIGWPKGAQLGTTNPYVGVMLDLGPDNSVKRVVATFQKPSATVTAGIFNIRLRNNASPDWTSGASAEDQSVTDITTLGASGFLAGTFTTTRRYVFIILTYIPVGAATVGEDNTIQLTSIKCFRDTAYESGTASILQADTVIKDALTFAPALNQSTALIQSGTFSIPEYLTGGYVSPRSVMEGINAYENYRLRIGGADLQTLDFGPKPSAPLVEVGDWSGAEFSDATVSGENIYSRAIVDATGPDGSRLVSSRTQAGTLVDRRGYARAMRLDVGSAVTQAVADRFADLWLTEHATAPFSGRLVVIGGGSVRNVVSGSGVPAHALLLYSGEKIRLANRVDPDTGAWGRDGRIAGITYRHDARQAEIAIDDRRDNFARILSRYGVLVNQFS